MRNILTIICLVLSCTLSLNSAIANASSDLQRKFVNDVLAKSQDRSRFLDSFPGQFFRPADKAFARTLVARVRPSNWQIARHNETTLAVSADGQSAFLSVKKVNPLFVTFEVDNQEFRYIYYQSLQSNFDRLQKLTAKKPKVSFSWIPRAHAFPWILGGLALLTAGGYFGHKELNKRCDGPGPSLLKSKNDESRKVLPVPRVGSDCENHDYTFAAPPKCNSGNFEWSFTDGEGNSFDIKSSIGETNLPAGATSRYYDEYRIEVAETSNRYIGVPFKYTTLIHQVYTRDSPGEPKDLKEYLFRGIEKETRGISDRLRDGMFEQNTELFGELIEACNSPEQEAQMTAFYQKLVDAGNSPVAARDDGTARGLEGRSP